MLKYITFVLCCLFSYNSLFAQHSLMVNAYNRGETSLNGNWKYIIDPYENGFYNYRYEPFENQSNPSKGAFFLNSKRADKSDLVEYDFDKMPSLSIPGDWNTQDEKLFYYEGTVWLKKSFEYKKSKDDNRVFLYFGASNYRTDVYFNGKKLGAHVGGFTPFQFEVTKQLLAGENFVVVKVDNKRDKHGVPTLNTDWWNFGGLTREVKLIETTETFIADYSVQLASADQIKVELSLDGNKRSNQKIAINIPELNITSTLVTNFVGKGELSIPANKINYWSPESPHLYDVVLSHKEDVITDQIGFRTIRTDGPNILLNGESIFLKGISIHEESPITHGRCNSKEDARKLLEWAKDLGCNYVRLAHYPHNEHMIRLADEMGILVWEEIPVYWTISWENEDTYLNAQNQIFEVITRDKNRASVIIWSMANETPTSEARNDFLFKLSSFTKEKDPTRLISAALEQHDYNGDKNVRTIDDPFAKVADILSFNQYIGWYDGNIEKCQRIKWNIQENKPVIISEFGAGAKFGLHGDKSERWTEEYQEYLYQETLKMIDQIDHLRGVSPWILADFKSPRRVLPKIQDNYNRKGLISEKGEKKKAFFVLRDYYNSKKWPK